MLIVTHPDLRANILCLKSCEEKSATFGPQFVGCVFVFRRAAENGLPAHGRAVVPTVYERLGQSFYIGRAVVPTVYERLGQSFYNGRAVVPTVYERLGQSFYIGKSSRAARLTRETPLSRVGNSKQAALMNCRTMTNIWTENKHAQLAASMFLPKASGCRRG